MHFLKILQLHYMRIINKVILFKAKPLLLLLWTTIIITDAEVAIVTELFIWYIT